MADPELGIFAGSFAKSFSQLTQQNKDDEQRDKLAKLQAKLVEAQLARGEIQLNAQTTLADLMTGTVQEFEPADPAITPGGREIPQFTNESREPLGLVDILSGGSPEGQLAALQSGVVSGKNILDFETAQNQLAAQGGLDKHLATLVDDNGVPIYRMAGFTQDSNGRLQRQWDLNPEANTTQQIATSVADMTTLVDDAFEIADIAKRSPALLASGVPGAQNVRDITSLFGAVKETFGFGDRGAGEEETTEDFDRKEKLYGVITQYNILKHGANTDQSRAGIMEISPSGNKSDAANSLLIADHLQDRISDAVISGIKMPADVRKRYIDYITSARDGTLLSNESEPVIDGPGVLKSASESFGKFADFTMEQIGKVDIPSLPPDQIEAFKAKFNQLKQQATPLVESVLEKAKAGLATAKDFAELTIEDIKQIDQEDVQAWTQEQVDELNKRRKQLGLGVKFILFKARRAIE